MNRENILKNIVLGNKNPKEAVMQLLGNNNNPIMQNLVKMAENGDYKGVENFARNMFKEQGRDLDKEVMQLQQIINNFR